MGADAIADDCHAFHAAIALLARPWTGLILNLLQDGPLRFSVLAERAHGIGDKVLSARLKELEAAGLVVREVDAGPPLRVSYALGEKGHGFHDVAVAIERWGRQLVEAPTKKKAPPTKAAPQKTKKKKKASTTTTRLRARP